MSNLTNDAACEMLRVAYREWLMQDADERAGGSVDVLVGRETHLQARLAEHAVESISDRDAAYRLAVDDFHAARGDYAVEEAQ